VVIRDRLILAVLVDLRGDTAALRSSVTRTAHALGMEAVVTIADAAPQRQVKTARSHVIVLGRPLRPGALSHVAQRIADIGANIESVAQLANEPVSSVEMIVRTRDPAELRAVLVQAAEDTGVDIAVEPAGLRRRAKRLVVLDVDSTLIRDEAIDVLADRAGVGEKVMAITEQAMAGQLEYQESLRMRVALLAGLTLADVEDVRDSLRLTPGAVSFVRTLRHLGYQVGVVSGGFTVCTDRFVAELELDFAAANELEIIDGRVTGRVLEPIIDGPGKAAALVRFAEEFRMPLSQTVAVGDGANDIRMLETAGLGIAFRAKPKLQAVAHMSLNHSERLDTLLYLMGYNAADLREAEAVSGWSSPPPRVS
jgi:phosphoserine phosphatase